MARERPQRPEPPVRVTRRELLEQARTWLKTPFRHQGRAKGRGVDCAGLVIGTLRELQLTRFDTTDYGRIPDPRRMGALLEQHLDRIRIQDARPGDVLWLAFEGNPQHLAFMTDLGIMHSYALARRVVEHRLDDLWRGRVRAAYTIPGVR